MDQKKIGKFIAECRKEQNLTQEELAEKLNITYKAISKWECGKGLPDTSIMMDLCTLLNISVNELLCGEKIKDSDYVSRAEENFINLKKKVDRVLIIICVAQFICLAIMVLLFIAHMYFNWLYRGPWDDSTFKLISNIILIMMIVFLLITGTLKYEVKK